MANIDQKLALTLCCATVQAYRAYEEDLPILAGYKVIDNWTAYDVITQTESVFGLVFEAENPPKHHIFAFRGTKTPMEFIEIINYEPVRFEPFEGEVPENVEVAEGWMNQYKNMQQKIFDLIDKYEPTEVYLSGHSLGGTLSTLFNLDLALCRPSYKPDLYTIGAPRVGLRGFVDFYNQEIKGTTVRISNYHDWAPCYPSKFQWEGYEHTTNPPYLLSFQVEWPAELLLGGWHWLDNYYKALCNSFGETERCELADDTIGPIYYTEYTRENCIGLVKDMTEEERLQWDKLMGEPKG